MPFGFSYGSVNKIKKLNKKIYPTMLHCITKVVNEHKEFRTTIDKEGNLGVFDDMLPCYTIFNKETETFSNIWTTYSEDYEEFCEDYEEDIKEFGHVRKMIAKPNVPQNSFSISMIPWVSFEGFNLNLQKGYEYLLPSFR
ncbi:MAG: CatA-like O-acetyltransferase [Sarcina sp.]